MSRWPCSSQCDSTSRIAIHSNAREAGLAGRCSRNCGRSAGPGLAAERAPGTVAERLLRGEPAVDGTFIWTPSHDQRPRSLSIALLRSWLRSLSARNRSPSIRWSARSEVRTNDLDGWRSVELPGDGDHGHGMWLIADLRTRLIRRSALEQSLRCGPLEARRTAFSVALAIFWRLRGELQQPGTVTPGHDAYNCGLRDRRPTSGGPAR